MAGLLLHNHAQRLAFTLVSFRAFQPAENAIRKVTASFGRKAALFILRDSYLAVDSADQGTINYRLPKLLNKVEGQTRLARTINMEKATIGIKPSQYQTAFNL